MQRTRTTSVLVLLALAGGAMAQSSVVPRRFGSADAPSLGWLAGLPVALRQEVLIASKHLAGLGGKKLLGVRLRRDASGRGALGGGAIDLQVWVSTSTSLDPDAPAAAFSSNHGRNRQRVFAGRVTVPASPPVGSSYDPWARVNTVWVPFTAPFRYTGGHLCLEIVGRSVPGRSPRFWPLDYDRDAVAGTVVPFGTSCSKLRFAGAHPATAWPSSMRPGATAIFSSFARPRTTALLLLGSRLLNGARGYPLAAAGAPGCTLYIDAQASLVRMVGSSRSTEPGVPAQVFVEAVLPADARLLGGSFLAQWAIAEWSLPPTEPRSNPLGLTTTNALRLTLAGTTARLGLSVVEQAVTGSSLPARGTVRIGMGPVLRFSVR